MTFNRYLEFPALVRNRLAYCDWTGAALPPRSLIEQHAQFLIEHVLGNPHSIHEPSNRSMELLLQARTRILNWFHADPDEYDVVFTANASAAIGILRNFRFAGGELLLSADNHNSVNGLRETAKRDGATVRYSPLRDDLELDYQPLCNNLHRAPGDGLRLFCYPLKSNYSGTRHNLSWTTTAQKLGWHVLADASAYLANDKLDLSDTFKPDFMPVSWYKIFGYPTGIGTLLIKKSAYRALSKRHFAGGSIIIVSVMRDWFAPEVPSPGLYEDGTTNFGSVTAVSMGLDFIDRLDADLASDRLSRYSSATVMSGRLYSGLRNLGDFQKNRVVIHSPRDTDVVTFSLVREGQFVDAWIVERMAVEERICLRTGVSVQPRH